MQYIIKDLNNEEHGPIDAETLAKWVDEDRVTAETSVRSSLMANWKTADNLAFLADRLAEQEIRKQKAATLAQKSGSVLQNAKKRLGEKLKSKVESKFEQKRPPQYAQMGPRFLAGLFDIALIILLGGFLYGIGITYAYYYQAANTDGSKQEIAEKDNMMIPVLAEERQRRVEIEREFEPKLKVLKGEELEKAAKELKDALEAEKVRNKKIKEEMHANNMTADCPPYTLADKKAGYQISSIWLDTTTGEKYICLSGKPGAARWLNSKYLTLIATICLAILAVFALLFNALSLGYYSQTFGMWFWGIFITKRKIAEVYFFRAFLFTLLYPLCFIFSPLFVYVFRRGLHEMLTGTRLVRVFSNRNG